MLVSSSCYLLASPEGTNTCYLIIMMLWPYVVNMDLQIFSRHIITCNSKWLEIADALRFEPGQRYYDRPNIVSLVFLMKLREFIDDIKGGDAFGLVRGGMLHFFSCVYHVSLSMSSHSCPHS